MRLHSTEHLEDIVKEIDEKDLESERAAARLKVFPSIDGSNKFQVMLFEPNSASFVAPNCICTCDKRKTQYRMCSLLKKYELDIVLLKKATPQNNIDKKDHVISEDFLFPSIICAVAASEISQDSAWFIRIDSEEQEALKLLTGDYRHCISSSQKYVAGKYIEKVGSKKQCQTYKLIKKNFYFFKDNIIYP